MSAKEVIVRGIAATRVIAARCERPALSCVVLPGNPGLSGYYRVFVESLLEESGKTMNVFAVSHAGHDQPVPGQQGETGRDGRDWFSLAEQVEHHISVIHELVPTGHKLVLVGHSLGSWMITRILPQLADYQVIKVVHLFPALAQLATSPNGRALSPYFNKYQWVVHFLLFLLLVIPTCVLDFIISRYFKRTPERHRSHMIGATKHLLSNSVMRNCMCLAHEEMSTIVELDTDALQANNAKTSYICARKDKWFPMERVRELKERVPDADVEIVTEIEHAFVLEKSEEVASMVWHRVERALL